MDELDNYSCELESWEIDLYWAGVLRNRFVLSKNVLFKCSGSENTQHLYFRVGELKICLGWIFSQVLCWVLKCGSEKNMSRTSMLNWRYITERTERSELEVLTVAYTLSILCDCPSYTSSIPHFPKEERNIGGWVFSNKVLIVPPRPH